MPSRLGDGRSIAMPASENRNGGRTVGMTRINAVALLAIYLVFLAYVLGRSADAAWAAAIAEWIRGLLEVLPTIT